MIMNEFDEVIFDDDEFLDDEPIEETPVDQEPKPNPDNDDLTTEVLRLKGITDPEKIKFEDETGTIIERSWNSLTKEEQLNILTQQEETRNELSENEIQLLNTIRSSGLSIEDYLNSLQVEPPVHLEVDTLSDEEVYALDLIDRIGADNISDEEIDQAIQNAKQNEEVFKKTVEGIRKEYVKLELDEKAQEENANRAKQEEAYNRFASSIHNEINNLNSFAGSELELSQDDAEELAEFMLGLDGQGVSAFGRALQDPSLMTKAAFWLLNEKQIVEELTKQMQDNYKRGYEAGKADKSPAVVINPNPSKSKKEEFYFDDDWD